nr:hypothetical protein [Brucella intermedia]
MKLTATQQSALQDLEEVSTMKASQGHAAPFELGYAVSTFISLFNKGLIGRRTAYLEHGQYVDYKITPKGRAALRERE